MFFYFFCIFVKSFWICIYSFFKNFILDCSEAFNSFNNKPKTKLIKLAIKKGNTLSWYIKATNIGKINNIDKYKTSIDEESGETKVNSFKVMFDKDQIAEISYDDIVFKGKDLRITTHKALKTNSSINSALNTNTVISKLSTIGRMPIIYNITAQEYIKSNF